MTDLAGRACARPARSDDRTIAVSRALRLSARLAVVALLAWQAGSALYRALPRAAATARGDWPRMLTADTDTRFRQALGADAQVLFDVRAAVPPQTILLNKKIMGRPEDFPVEELLRLAAKNGLVDQLTTLLYPDPWLFSVPEPIAEVERQARAGREMLLFTTPGDPDPAGRSGWQRTVDNPRFAIWRFRTD